MIVKTPGVCGGSARIDGTRITVWLIMGLLLNESSDLDVEWMYPELKHEDITDAKNYWYDNKEEIEKELKENA